MMDTKNMTATQVRMAQEEATIRLRKRELAAHIELSSRLLHEWRTRPRADDDDDYSWVNDARAEPCEVCGSNEEVCECEQAEYEREEG